MRVTAKGVLFAGAEGEADGVLVAAVGTGAAQDALGIFHVGPLDHVMDVEAHGAFAGTGQAVGTLGRFGHQAQRRPADQVAQLAAEDHKGRHPADGVAARSAAKDHSQDEKEADDDIVDHVPGRGAGIARDGEGSAAVELIEGVDGMIAAGGDGQGGDAANPGDPDGPLDPVGLAARARLVVDRGSELLQGAGRTGPAAPQPPDEQGSDEHQAEDDKAAVDNALPGAVQDERGGKVVEGDGEEQEGEEQQPLSNPLARWQLLDLHGVRPP